MKCIIGAAALSVASPALAQYSPPPQTSAAGTALAIANRAAGQPYQRPPAGCFAVAPEVTITILQSYAKLPGGGAIWQVQLGRTTGFLAVSLAPSVPPVAAAVRTPAKVAPSQPTPSEPPATKPSDGTFATASLSPAASPQLKSGRGAPATNCDAYSASPLDSERVADGVAVEKINPDLAVPACESALRQYPSSARLNFQLGRAYYKANNFDAALKQYLKAAEQNHPLAQTNLGKMYEKGEGVAKDDAQAVSWYRRAAEQGNALGQTNLAFMYVTGRGVLKDEAKGAAWYLKAAEQGNAVAQANLGLLYESGRGIAKDEVRAVVWLRKAAEQGEAIAQKDLGNMYHTGRGVLQNYAEAVKWWRKAADQGDANAQDNLGVMYQRGQGIAQNYPEAVKWYQKAADQGNAAAQDNLGVMYSEGHGVPQDFAEATKWFSKQPTREIPLPRAISPPNR
jgi:TPR repeat protein